MVHWRSRAAGVAMTCAAVIAITARSEAYQPGAVQGDWTTTGTSSKFGSYTGTVTLTERTDGKVGIATKITTSSGKKISFTATGTVAGDKITFSGRTSTGIIGGLFGIGARRASLKGSYTVGAGAKSIDGSWTLSDGTTFTEKSTRAAAPVAGTLLTLVDGNGADVPNDKKVTAGVVVADNIDDDDDVWKNADGKVDVSADKSRTGIRAENDLLPFKLKKPAGTAAGAQWKLTFPAAKLAVWRTKTKDASSKVESGAAFAADDATLYVEGVAPSDAGAGESLGVSLVVGGQEVSKDQGTVRVARSAFLLLGHGNSGSYVFDGWLSGRKLDRRTNPVLVMGKDEAGKPVAWAGYLWRTEKLAKLAFSVPGSVIAYDGHSNFGLGYSFDTHYKSVKEFMNIADAQVPVNWIYLREHQEHPDLMFEDAEYADDASTTRFSDPVQVERRITGAHSTYDTIRFPASGGSGVRCSLTRATPKFHDSHYGSGENLRIVVKAGSKDMPAKKWAKIFLNSCYGGQYYYDSFGGQGTLFFTHDEASSSRTSSIFLQGCIDGRTNEQTLSDLNAVENINDYYVFTR